MIRRRHAGPRVFFHKPTGRTGAQVRAVGIDTIVGTFMFVLAFVDIHADAFLMRIRISRGTCTIVLLRICTLVLEDDASTIVFSEFESCRAGTRVGSFEILTIMTAIVRRLVLTLVVVNACVKAI